MFDLATREGTVIYASGGAMRHLVGDPETGRMYASDMARHHVLVVDTATATDLDALANNVSFGTTATLAAGTSTPLGPLTLCAETDAGVPLTGDLFRVLIYASALTSTQRGINLAVDEWALGGTLPVTP